MNFGKTVGTACASFAVTNIDDIFVLVTFFAESSTSRNLTPLKVTLGQYIGFTVIVVISMIGFGVSLVIASEPIGFLGLLPIILGIWKFFELVMPDDEDDDEASKIAGIKSIIKVSTVTVMNGGDNIGTYVPLFAQARGAEIAVYVVVYYILLGVWCLVAYLVMKQRHILALVQKYIAVLIPLLYVGLGIFITVKSDCYPWSIEHIDRSAPANPGRAIMAGVTVAIFLTCIGGMWWFRWSRTRSDQPSPDIDMAVTAEAPQPTTDGAVDAAPAPTDISSPAAETVSQIPQTKV